MIRKTLITFLILCIITPASWVDSVVRECDMPPSKDVMAGGHVDAEATCYVRCMGDHLSTATDQIPYAITSAPDGSQCCLMASSPEMVVIAPALPADGKRSTPVLVTPRIERSASLPAQTFVLVNGALSSAFSPKLYHLHAAYLI